jgi:hypothetical protein
MFMYDIKNALTEKSLPLSDNIHGMYKMMLPELLHTSGSGLIVYMFESLRDQMGEGKDRYLIDRQHILISNLIRYFNHYNIFFQEIQTRMDTIFQKFME